MTSYRMRSVVERVWEIIKDPSDQFAKTDIIQMYRHKHGLRPSDYYFFGTTARRLLENKAATEGKAVIIEHGFMYATKSEDKAFRKILRDMRYQVTHGISLGNAGNGVNLLKGSSDQMSLDLAGFAEMMASQAVLMADRLDAMTKAVVARDRAARAKAAAKAKAVLSGPVGKK